MSKITDITVILDKSSSMTSYIDETIDGFNSFLEDQRQEEGEARMTLIQFSSHDEIDTVYQDRDVSQAPKIDNSVYIPGGSTALLDSIAKGIALGKSRESEHRERLYVIITDGVENDSQEYDSAEEIKELVESEREDGNEFIFLGAAEGVDAFDVSQSIGIQQGKTMSYSQSNDDQYSNTYDAASSLTSRTRNHDAEETAFSEDERSSTGGMENVTGNENIRGTMDEKFERMIEEYEEKLDNNS